MQRRAVRPVAAGKRRPEGWERLPGATEVDTSVHLVEGGSTCFNKWQMADCLHGICSHPCCMQILRGTVERGCKPFIHRWGNTHDGCVFQKLGNFFQNHWDAFHKLFVFHTELTGTSKGSYCGLKGTSLCVFWREQILVQFTGKQSEACIVLPF